MRKKILITGVSGFIGFSLAFHFLKKNYYVYGIDNFDQYYSVKLKKMRLLKLKKFTNFKFNKIDINDVRNLKFFLKNKKFNYVYHMAAQAGVRYSLQNPLKYINTNILAFFNLLNLLKRKVINHIYYASSSSVYGDNNNFPIKENALMNPKNIYGLSKKFNEKIADFFYRVHNYNITGLRFFTVYGEWGRPDMFIMKLLRANKNKLFFNLNNNGNHFRDFTYINDVVEIIDKLTSINQKGHKIYNICSNNPVNLKYLIRFKNLFKNLKVVYKPKINIEVLKTHGDNALIKKVTNYKKFTSINIGFLNTFNWYKKNNINKIS
jgi:UDP-glucuronate 4-epimerase